MATLVLLLCLGAVAVAQTSSAAVQEREQFLRWSCSGDDS